MAEYIERAAALEITPGDFCSYGEPKEGNHA